jgi:hypothetical protein
MGKNKAPKGKKTSAASNLKAVPCLVLIVSIFGILMLLFYWVLKSST